MASSSPHLSDDTNGVSIVELVDSEDDASPDQKPPNTTKIDEDASSSSTVDALKIDTIAIPCKSESLAFEKFISACTPHLKIPGDEPIIEKLRMHFAKLNLECRQLTTISVDLEKLTLQINKRDVYIVIHETLNYFRSCHSKSASKKQAYIMKLEKILGSLDKKIQELQEREVDFDKGKYSTYMLECRYKERFALVYSKLCDVVGCSTRDPKPKIDYNGTRFPEINRNITRYLRKNEEFPDFKDILEIIAETNEQAKLLMSEEQISRMARQVFEEVGAKLKKQRIDEFESTLGCTLTDNEVEGTKDPATNDTDLREKLENNKKLAKIRLDELMETFVVKQESRGEGEAAASNPEEEDDDDDDEAEEDGGRDDDQQEMEDIDEDRILLIEIDDSPSETEESEVDQKTDPFSSGKNSPLEEDVIPKIELSEPSKNGFLSDLDIKPTVSILAKTLATSHSSELEEKFSTASRRGFTSTPQSYRNPLFQSVKRRLSDEDEVSVKHEKKRIVLQTVVNDDDVIVLSD